MQKFLNIYEEKQNTAVALGFFDGVHIGHRKVINLTVNQKLNGLVPVCFTFSESPKSILTSIKAEAVMTDADKEKTLAQLGVEQVMFSNFKEIMNITAQQFFYDILVKKLKAKKLYCGFNYHFGKNGEGDVALLKNLCDENDLELTVVPPTKMNGKVVSSTLIREYIKNGNVKTANKMLFGKFGFCGKIEHGQQLGRTLGTPTINQNLDSKLVVPKFGVYASAITLSNGVSYCGVTNIGVKPTVGQFAPVCETWMPDYNNGEIYGEIADVRLLEFIREEKKFNNLQELKNAIFQNAETAQKIYNQQQIHSKQ